MLEEEKPVQSDKEDALDPFDRNLQHTHFRITITVGKLKTNIYYSFYNIIMCHIINTYM